MLRSANNSRLAYALFLSMNFPLHTKQIIIIINYRTESCFVLLNKQDTQPKRIKTSWQRIKIVKTNAIQKKKRSNKFPHRHADASVSLCVSLALSVNNLSSDLTKQQQQQQKRLLFFT